ncbi:hypothetical protein ACOJIV_19655 [Haloarcula sp. AONF1]|jgi:hypothetical protein
MVLPQLAAAGAVAYGGAKAVEYLTTSEHDRALKKTYKHLESTVPDATLFVDHIDVDVAGNPEGVLDIDRIPDLILHNQRSANLVVEVETGDSLRNAGDEARAQLQAFGSPGYRRVLVVPEDASGLAKNAIQDWPIDDETIYVANPSTVSDAL